MAKAKTQAEEPRETEGATSTAKKAKRPSKKQATKKTAKKPAKKTNTRSSTPRVSKKRSSKKPAKKQPSKKTAKKQSAKKPAKKARKPAQQAKKSAKKAEMPAAQEERTVISSPPSRRRRERERVEATASAEQNRKEAETAQTQTPQDVQPEEMQWGRRTRRSAPIGWEDRAGVSAPAQPARRQDATAENQPVEAPAEPVEAPPQARTETPAQNKREEPKEEDTRKVSRPPKGRSRSETPAQSKREEPKKESTRVSRPHSGRNQGDQNKQRTSKRTSDRGRRQKPEQPSNRLTQILAQSWTEDKTRQFISEGFLGSLSPELVNNEKSETIPDAERLKEPLKMIRKVLADECMVADDVTDLMLLDVVMNALSDRIDVCRLQAESNALADIHAILELRYKADRRLIEAVNALKNA